jgi:hypothetical protein
LVELFVGRIFLSTGGQVIRFPVKKLLLVIINFPRARDVEFLSPSALHDAAQRDIHLIHFGMCEVPISKHPLKSKSHKCMQRSAAQQEISFQRCMGLELNNSRTENMKFETVSSFDRIFRLLPSF